MPYFPLLSDLLQRIRSFYKNAIFIWNEVLVYLEQAEPHERFKHLTTVIDESNSSIFARFPYGNNDPGSLKLLVNYFINIMKLLGEKEDRKKILGMCSNVLYLVLTEIVHSERISEAERVELAEAFCQLLKANMSLIEIRQYLYGKYPKQENLTLYAAKQLRNADVFDLIYELTKGDKQQRSTCCCFKFFHLNKKPQREFLVSNVLRNHQITVDERHQHILKGRTILEELLKTKPTIAVLVEKYGKEDRALADKLFFQYQGDDYWSDRQSDRIEAYAIRCLYSAAGLYALGNGLITLANAKRYAEKGTLEFFLANPDLPLLRLYNPDELTSLEGYQVWSITGDYAFIALEENLITLEQLSKITEENHSILDALFSYYGIIALREKLLSLDDCIKMTKNNYFPGSKIKSMLTPEGITALRKGLYSSVVEASSHASYSC